MAKSFYRTIGTVIGAAVALFPVALCAQERVLFLGGLALSIGLCTFGSQYARNFAAYALSCLDTPQRSLAFRARSMPGTLFTSLQGALAKSVSAPL